ncbi:hypothetical protein Syun_021363 [Stephania yunnanensis]|uniref:Uncharacterized protein n=1 Tax=Stephania yunnanensis TaxID=152371 RepID=A0AAP0NS78_9MAGN
MRRRDNQAVVNSGDDLAFAFNHTLEFHAFVSLLVMFIDGISPNFHNMRVFRIDILPSTITSTATMGSVEKEGRKKKRKSCIYEELSLKPHLNN